jgi:hypothetical protein
MRRNSLTIFVISTLITLILCSACVSPLTTNQPSQQNGGLTLTTLKTESSSISFEKAYQNLMNYRSDPTNDSSAINTIYTIYGMNIDRSGNATSWVFGVRHSGGTELLAYDQSGLTRIPWNAPPFSSEINVNNIVPPNSLFSQNSAIILSNPSPIERQDLELSRGTYTLTITSGTQERVLTFNVTTGKLIL